MKCTPKELEKSEAKRCENPDNDFQQFPSRGKLKQNMNLSMTELKKQLKESGGETVFSYVVASVGQKDGNLIQFGSGPNFQGGVITLSTCKHKMRTFKNPDNWKGIWIAGIAPKNTAQNAVFYLMKVSEAFESQADLWNHIDEDVRKAKNSRYSILGDMFEPRKRNLVEEARFKAENYYTPHQNHVHAGIWETDIDYSLYKKHSSLLKGDINNSFLWNSPKIYLSHPEGKVWKQGQKKWDFNDFTNALSSK